MKVWVDDQINDPECPVRHTPENWIGVKTAKEAIKLLKTGQVSLISLDHDLGDNVIGNGYTIVQWIEREVILNKFEAPEIEVHSANPVGAEKIKKAIESIKKGR